MSDRASDTMTGAVGHRRWTIAEGYIPPASSGETRELTSHETLRILNADREVRVELTLYFAGRAPAGPFVFTIGAQRTRHLRFNDFRDPEPIPKGTGFSSVVNASVPVVVQHTRLDSRQPALVLLSTMAFPFDS